MFGSGLNGMYAYPKSVGLLAGLKKINWGSFLSNTQKTLNIVNQTIPLVYQVKPLVNNAKTVFKIIGAVKDDNTTSKTENIVQNNVNNANNTTNNTSNNTSNNISNHRNDNQPNFFI